MLLSNYPTLTLYEQESVLEGFFEVGLKRLQKIWSQKCNITWKQSPPGPPSLDFLTTCNTPLQKILKMTVHLWNLNQIFVLFHQRVIIIFKLEQTSTNTTISLESDRRNITDFRFPIRRFGVRPEPSWTTRSRKVSSSFRKTFCQVKVRIVENDSSVR